MDIRKKRMIRTCKEWMLILQMQRRYYNYFLLESLQFLYQENDQSRWQKVRVKSFLL